MLIILEDKFMIRFKTKGNYDKTEKFLKNNKDSRKIVEIMEKYGREGIAALSADTPVDTGDTSSSWNYEIKEPFDSFLLYSSRAARASSGVFP